MRSALHTPVAPATLALAALARSLLRRREIVVPNDPASHQALALGIPVLAFAVIAGLGRLFVGALVGPYALGHHRGSFEEIADVSSGACP